MQSKAEDMDGGKQRREKRLDDDGKKNDNKKRRRKNMQSLWSWMTVNVTSNREGRGRGSKGRRATCEGETKQLHIRDKLKNRKKQWCEDDKHHHCRTRGGMRVMSKTVTLMTKGRMTLSMLDRRTEMIDDDYIDSNNNSD